MVECTHFEGTEIESVASELRALEQRTLYPIQDGEDHFTIDHGDDYAAFFRGIGQAHFLVARHGEQVVGSIAGALNEVHTGHRRVPAVYLGDLKVHEDFRGRGVARKIALKALSMTTQRRFRRWRVAYFAAMRGSKGDVARSFTTFHAGRLLRPQARLALYFASPDCLQNLSRQEPPTPPPGLNLSPNLLEDRVTTRGTKDLRLQSTGKPWPLVHLPLSPRDAAERYESFGGYLRHCGSLDWAPGELACFAVDERLSSHIDWLRDAGLEADATCTIYTLAWPGVLRSPPWCHIATAQI